MKTLEDEVTRNNEHEKEEAKLKAILEYQRQIEEGNKHEPFSHQGVNENPLSNQELLTGTDELKEKLSGLSLEYQEVSGTLRSKRQKKSLPQPDQERFTSSRYSWKQLCKVK